MIKKGGVIFSKKSVFLKNFSVPGPFEQVFFSGANVQLGGSPYPWKTSLKWLTVMMPLLETSKKQERDKTRVRLE